MATTKAEADGVLRCPPWAIAQLAFVSGLMKRPAAERAAPSANGRGVFVIDTIKELEKGWVLKNR